MIQQQTAGRRIHILFRTLSVAALVGAFCQVTLGGVVRVTGSGLGCPDWPLCHGRLIPPFDLATLIEYSHRLSASALMVLVVGTAVLALLFYRRNRRVLSISLVSVGLVIAAGILGGVTVLTELSWWTVLIHLGIAEVLVAAIVLLVVSSWRAHEKHPATAGRTAVDIPWLLPVVVVGALVLILSGSFIVGYGAGSACPSWPLCVGATLPGGTAYAIHMGHRFVSVVVGAAMIGAALWAWSRRADYPGLGWAGLALSLILIVQILIGAWMVWSGFPASLKAVHLSLATLTWTALMFLAALVYSPHGIEPARVGTRPDGTPRLKELAT